MFRRRSNRETVPTAEAPSEEVLRAVSGGVIIVDSIDGPWPFADYPHDDHAEEIMKGAIEALPGVLERIASRTHEEAMAEFDTLLAELMQRSVEVTGLKE